MITIDGVEYGTKEEAAAKCRDYVAAHRGTTFYNRAHSKVVRRPTTEEEQAVDKAAGRSIKLTVDVYEWNKLSKDSPILKVHPELKGAWTYRHIDARRMGWARNRDAPKLSPV